MRVSVVVPDSMVIVDGVARQVDVSGLDASLHAVQWDGITGEVEYGKPRNENIKINDISIFQFLIDRWVAAAPKPVPPPPPPTKDEQVTRTLSDPVLAALVAELAARTLTTESVLLEAIKGRMP